MMHACNLGAALGRGRRVAGELSWKNWEDGGSVVSRNKVEID